MKIQLFQFHVAYGNTEEMKLKSQIGLMNT